MNPSPLHPLMEGESPTSRLLTHGSTASRPPSKNKPWPFLASSLLTPLLLTLGLLFTASCTKTSTPTAESASRIALEPATTTIGGQTSLTIDLFPEAGHRPAPLDPALNPDLTITDRSRLQRLDPLADGRNHYAQQFTLAAFVTGSIPILVTNQLTTTSTNGTHGTLTLDTNLLLTVETTLTESDRALIPATETAITTNELLYAQRDDHLRATLRGEAKPPPSVTPWGLIFAILAGLLLFALLLWRFLRLFKPKPIPAPPPEAAHLIAFRQLDHLYAQPHLHNGEADPFFTKLSRILRDYLEGQLDLRAPDQTTEEFLRDLEKTPHLTPEQKQTLDHFSSQADLVKFARAAAGPEHMQSAWDTARTLVEQTKDIDPNPPAVPEAPLADPLADPLAKPAKPTPEVTP